MDLDRCCVSTPAMSPPGCVAFVVEADVLYTVLVRELADESVVGFGQVEQGIEQQVKGEEGGLMLDVGGLSAIDGL